MRLSPLLTASAVLVLAGCALRGPRPVIPVTADGLLSTLSARRAAVNTVRARARLKSTLSGMWIREAILVQRPDAVRIDVLSPFGLALAVGARRTSLWAYQPADGALYQGSATPANLSRFLGAPVAIADVVDILLGLPPAREPDGTPTLALAGGEYRLTVPLRDGVQTIWFASDTLAVLRAEEAHRGEIALRVAFEDHHDGFPHMLELGVPASGASARLAYDTIEQNVPLDATLFAPPAAVRVLPLPSP